MVPTCAVHAMVQAQNRTKEPRNLGTPEPAKVTFQRCPVRFALGGGDAALRFAEQIVGAQAPAAELGERRLDAFVVAEEVVIEVERLLE